MERRDIVWKFFNKYDTFVPLIIGFGGVADDFFAMWG